MKGQFTVHWEREALRELARHWIRSADRAGITRAQAQIDLTLATAPLGNSAAVAEGLRRLTVTPLVCYFEVDVANATVQVEQIGMVIPP